MTQITQIPSMQVRVVRDVPLFEGKDWASAAEFFRSAVGRQPITATITIGDESTNVRTINIAFKNTDGAAIDYVEPFFLVVFASSALTAFATGGSTGVAIGTNGALLALVAKKAFLCTTEADGTWDGTWTDTGTESVALAVMTAGGQWTVSADFANAA
jgi:hypothetical protein